jgi:hypothetical protein
MAGTNDLKRRSAAEITSSLEQLHATCHAAGARTLALGIPHSKASTVGSHGRSERRREVRAGPPPGPNPNPSSRPVAAWAPAEEITYSGHTPYSYTGERVAACVRCAQRRPVRVL